MGAGGEVQNLRSHLVCVQQGLLVATSDPGKAEETVD